MKFTVCSEKIEKEKMIQELTQKIVDDFLVGEKKDEMKKYKVALSDILFETQMTDEELIKSVEAAVDLMHELIHINEEGLNQEEFSKICDEKIKDGDIFSTLLVCRECFENEKVKKIISDLTKIRRVGGAYAMLLSIPTLEDAIYSVYKAGVDQWNDNDDFYYLHGIYFLIRAIMHMHCDEIN